MLGCRLQRPASWSATTRRARSLAAQPLGERSTVRLKPSLKLLCDTRFVRDPACLTWAPACTNGG